MSNRPAPPDDGAMPAMDEGLDERGYFAEQPPKTATLKRSVLAKPEEKQAHYHGHRDRLRAHYHGHRDRLRARYRENGDGALADYELLELLLFRLIPPATRNQSQRL